MLLKLTELGEVVARRTLSLANGEQIVVRIGLPFAPTEYNGNYCCPYQIQGIGDEAIRYGAGVDSLQALYLALISISTDLYTSNEGRSGQITWEGEGELGLPFADAISDLVPNRRPFRT